MSEAELKLLKRVGAVILAGVGWVWGVCEHNRAERYKQEAAKAQQPWTERVERNEEEIGSWE